MSSEQSHPTHLESKKDDTNKTGTEPEAEGQTKEIENPETISHPESVRNTEEEVTGDSREGTSATSSTQVEKESHGAEGSVEKTSDNSVTAQLKGLEISGLGINSEPLAQSTTDSSAVDKPRAKSPSPPPPPPKDEKFLTSPGTSPTIPRSPKTPTLNTDFVNKEKSPVPIIQTASQNDGQAEAEQDDSQSEIQSIMEQFDDGKDGPKADEIMSPRLELAGPLAGSPHPPRKSSLEAASTTSTGTGAESTAQLTQSMSPPPPRSSSLANSGTTASVNEKSSGDVTASPRPASLFKPPPPELDPEPDLPFDFHRFLEQLRHRTADPVAKYLRSFLLEFGKKQWMVHEQIKIISDFLNFISKKMARCEVWRVVSDAEFDNAREGMEKLVMNRLYTQTFSPEILPPPPFSGGRGAKKPLPQDHLVLGRRGQHQEDVERDEVLAQKVRIYKWVREEHLDIKPISEKGKRFLALAQQELLKINSYRAPRDKIICVLNCCKVIFGFLRNSQTDQSADSFVPLLIYTVLRANPEHLVSNVQYILRFRNQEKLGGEAGYYLSSLMAAVQFIESLDRTTLTITDKEFEANVEAAVSAIAERHTNDAESSRPSERDRLKPQTPHKRAPSPHGGVRLSEKSTISQPQVTPRNSLDSERIAPRHSSSRSNSNVGLHHPTDAESEENAAVAGLLRTIQKPLTTIGRIFSDDGSQPPQPPGGGPASTPQPGSTPRASPHPPGSSLYPSQQRQAEKQAGPPRLSGDAQQPALSAEDAAARQASAELEEARRIQRQEHRVVVDTLAGMFPKLDRDVIDDVVRVKEGRVGLAVDACLALSN